MIILAAMLASGPALPWLDRAWLNDQVRIEASTRVSPSKASVRRIPSPAAKPRELSYETNVIAM